MWGSKANIFIGKYEPKLDGGGGMVGQSKQKSFVWIFSLTTLLELFVCTRREFVSVLFCLEVPEFFRVTFSLIDRHCPVVFFLLVCASFSRNNKVLIVLSVAPLSVVLDCYY